MFYIIGSICQIITAIVASFSLITTLLLESKKNKFSQSKLVTTWLDDNVVIISNQSGAAVYNVFMFADLNVEKSDLITHLERIKQFQLPFDYIEVLPPHKETRIKIRLNSAAGNKHLLPSILFTDSQNRQWYRRENGIIKPFKNNYLEELSKKEYIVSHV